MLSTFIESPTTVDRVWLRPGLWTSLTFADLNVQATGTTEPGVFAHIESTTIRLALLPLLRRQLKIGGLTGEDLSFDVAVSEEGVGNWPVWTTFTYEIVEIEGVDLRDVTIGFEDRSSSRNHRILLERIETGVSQQDPLDLRVKGSFGDQAFELTGEGPSLPGFKQLEGWPLTADLSTEGFDLHLDGSLGGEAPHPSVDLGITLRGSDLILLARLAGQEPVGVGAVELEGRLIGGAETYALEELRAVINQTDFAGELRLDLASQRPVLAGALEFGRLHLEDLDTLSKLEASEKVIEAHRPEEGDLSALFETLGTFDLHLALEVDEMTGLAIKTDTLSADLSLEEGVFKTLFGLHVAEGSVEGSMSLDVSQSPPTLSMDLDLAGHDLETLAELLEIEPGATGSVGQLKLDARSQGSSYDQIVESLGFEMELAGAAFEVEAGMDEPIAVTLDRAEVRQVRGESLRATALVDYLGEAATVGLVTFNLSGLLDGNPFSFELGLDGGGAVATAAGRLTPGQDSMFLDASFSVEGARIGDLATWTGLSPEADLSYRFRGRFSSSQGPPRFWIDEGQVGRSSFVGQARWLRDPAPLFQVEIVASELDSVELGALMETKGEDAPAGEVFWADEVVLPTQKSFADADINVTAERIYRDGDDLTDLSVVLQMRDGRLDRSPFSFRWGAAAPEGLVSLDLRTEIPELRLSLQLEQPDLGVIIEQTGLAEGADLTADRIDFSIRATGSTIRELIEQSSFSGSGEGLLWRLPIPETEDFAEVHFAEVHLRSPVGTPIVLQGSGNIEEFPAELRITVGAVKPDGRFEFDHLPFDIRASSGDWRLAVSGDVDLPYEPGDLEVQVSVRGSRLDRMSALFGTALPPYGPYDFEGRVEVAEDFVSLSDMRLTMGESRLEGEISLDNRAEPSKVTANFVSQNFRIEDFLIEDEQDEAESGADEPETVSAEVEREPPIDVEPTADDQPVLTPGQLHDLELDLAMEFSNLEAAGESFGAGKIVGTLHGGQLTALLDWSTLTGGTARVDLELGAFENQFKLFLDASVDDIDYGLLESVLEIEAKQTGKLDFNAKLSGEGPTLVEALGASNGIFDFITFPDEVHTEMIDLWGGHVIRSVVPILNPGQTSKLNCAVGHFTVRDGVMNADHFVLDTTRTRIRGQGEIDLAEMTIDLRLKPRPKTRGFLSLATPVRIKGPLTDPSLTVKKGGLAVTGLRLYYALWTFWLELLRKPLPADGSDICIDPPRRDLILPTD